MIIIIISSQGLALSIGEYKKFYRRVKVGISLHLKKSLKVNMKLDCCEIIRTIAKKQL